MAMFAVEVNKRMHRVASITLEMAVIKYLRLHDEDYRKPGYKPTAVLRIKSWRVPEGK